MLEGLKDAIEFLFTKGEKAALDRTVVEIGGQQFTPIQNLRELHPEPVKIQTRPFGAVADFAEFLKHLGNKDAVVWVHENGAVAVLTPKCRQAEVETLTLSPYRAALPTDAWMDIPDFVEFLDRYSGILDEEQALRSCVKILKFSDTRGAEFSDRGAFIQVTFKAEKKVETPDLTLPKVLHFNVPFGDPGYDMKLCYRLSVRTDGSGADFALKPLPLMDQRFEQFVGRALTDLRTALTGTGIQVYRGVASRE